jgi:hypothetical protein
LNLDGIHQHAKLLCLLLDPDDPNWGNWAGKEGSLFPDGVIDTPEQRTLLMDVSQRACSRRDCFTTFSLRTLYASCLIRICFFILFRLSAGWTAGRQRRRNCTSGWSAISSPAWASTSDGCGAERGPS